MSLNRQWRLASVGILLLGIADAAAAPVDITFSVDPASPRIDGNLTPDDVLVPGPSISIQGRTLGLADSFFTGHYDNLADFSFGRDPIRNPLYFSVDRVAIGLPGSAVFREAAPGVESAADDIFVSLPPRGSNALFVSQSDLGLAPGFFGDDVDGLNLGRKPSPNTYFAIDRFSAMNGFGTGSLPSQLLVSAGNGTFSIYATNGMIGLAPDDAIDGLVLWDQNLDARADPRIDKALFSIDPFSSDAFTSTGLDYIACVPGHMSPADVCFTDFTGTFSLWASAADLGLRPDDNLDALATVPEPGTWALTAGGLLMCWIARTRSRPPTRSRRRIDFYTARIAHDAVDAPTYTHTSELRVAEDEWPRIRFHALREHAGLMFQTGSGA